MDNLVVADEEYAKLKEALGAFGDAAEEQITEYLRVIASVCDAAITDGDTAENLKAFAICARDIMGKAKELTGYMQSSCDALLGSIDQADEYLY